MKIVIYVATLTLAACSTSPDRAPNTPRPVTPAPSAAPALFELAKNGRIYVFRSEANLHKFEQTDEVQYARTLIGAGPQGETVVFETTKDADPLIADLEAAWAKKHGVTLR